MNAHPTLRRRLRTLLYPPPGDAGYASAGRWLFWALLAVVTLAGVMSPYLMADRVRGFNEWVSPASAPASAGQGPTPAGLYPPGTRLRDCRDSRCPWLVVLPTGSFLMGSPASEAGRDIDEGPQHKVTIATQFAIMETEVTRGQFAAFVADSRHRTEQGCYAYDEKSQRWELQTGRDWRNPGFAQADEHPVVCVNWTDARAYADWLSRRTRQTYRLPSESQWEYAARAGTTTRYAFGDGEADLCRHGNVVDRSLGRKLPEFPTTGCDDRTVFTAPVAQYQRNGWGLYDMHGNVQEWVQDCGIPKSYDGSPTDGSAVESSDCTQRLLRGGAWVGEARNARSANRNFDDAANRNDYAGFRLTRMLPAGQLSP